MIQNRFLQTRVGIFNALIYLPYGVLLPFLALWFGNYGWDWAQISIILGMSMTVSIFFDPIVGAIADRTQAFRLLTFILATLSIISWLLLPLFNDNFYWILLCYTLFRLFWVAIIPIIDNLGLAITKDLQGNWGILRSSGSIAFIITAQLTGFLITGREDWADLMYQLVAAFMVVLVAGTVILPRYQITKENLQTFSRVKLLAQPSMALFVLGVFLIAKSHGQELYFGSVRWSGVGFSPSRISDLWTMRVGAEVISFITFGYVLRTQDSLRAFRNLCFIFAGSFLIYLGLSQFNISYKFFNLFTLSDIANILFTLTYGSALVGVTVVLLYFIRKETRPADLVIIGAFASIIRWAVLASTSQEQLIFIAESLHALTYGAFMIGSLTWVRSALPQNLSTTAVGLFNGALMLGFSIGAYLAGIMWQHYEEKSWYFESGIAAFGLVCLIFAFSLYAKEKQNLSKKFS